MEATIVASSLVLLCAGLVFVHAYSAGQLSATVHARERVWRNAMTECNQPEPLLQDLARDLIAGRFPVPDNIVPYSLEGSGSFSATSLWGDARVSGSKSLLFVCNPRPSNGNPLAKPNEWVLDLFM